MRQPRLADRRRRVGQGRQRVRSPGTDDERGNGPALLRPRASLIPLPDVSGYLLPKEQILYLDRKHPMVLIVPALIAFGIFIIGGALVSASGAGPMLTLYVWIVLGVVAWLIVRVVRWSRTVLVVSNRRVFEYRRLMMAHAAIKPVFRQSVVFRQGPIGQRMNYGTILTETPNGDRVNTFEWIHNPTVFYQAVTDKAV